jgi:hypothetical protein
MTVIQFTPTQLNSLQGLLDLFDKRAREPTNQKKTQINYHSISKHLNIDYKCVRLSLNNLNKKIKELNEY